MKIALIGATGFVGAAVLKEALDKGHEVIALARHPENIEVENENLTAIAVDVFDTDALAEALKGSDIVISAYNPGWTNPNIYADALKGAASIQEATKKAGVKRLLVIGGAGSLFVAPGLQLIDTPEFPAAYKEGAGAARDYLNIIQKEETLDWTFLSPAIEMHQGTSGTRVGKYRIGLDNPMFDENNRSILSVEDLALAIVDEAEQAKHIRQRFTVAY